MHLEEHVVFSERTTMIKLIRIKELSTIISSSRSKIYADIQDGTFIPPIALGSRAVAFPENEVAEWVKARIAGASVGELRALVTDLVSKRKLLFSID